MSAKLKVTNVAGSLFSTGKLNRSYVLANHLSPTQQTLTPMVLYPSVTSIYLNVTSTHSTLLEQVKMLVLPKISMFFF